MKRLRILFYRWHNWVGIVLAVPILIVSVSAILLAFKNVLNLEKFSLSTAVIPGYYLDKSENSFIHEIEDIKCVFSYRDTLYLGTKYGLILSINENLLLEKDLIGVDIRKIVQIENRIYIAGNKGIWMKENNFWKKLFSGNVHDIGSGKNGQLFAALGKGGIITSSDKFRTVSTQSIDYLKNRINNKNIISELNSVRNITLKDFALDLHTGRAFFGKKNEWIWTLIVASSIILLVLTGSVLWIRKKVRR